MGLLCLATSSRPYSPGQPVNSPTLRRASGAAGMLAEPPWALAQPQAKPLCRDVVPAYQPPVFPVVLPTQVPNNTWPPSSVFSYAQHTTAQQPIQTSRQCMVACFLARPQRTCAPAFLEPSCLTTPLIDSCSRTRIITDARFLHEHVAVEECTL